MGNYTLDMLRKIATDKVNHDLLFLNIVLQQIRVHIQYSIFYIQYPTDKVNHIQYSTCFFFFFFWKD